MRPEIRFSLNGRMRRLQGPAPHTTLLDWLRGEGLTAVKEGCAEGDCGACSVLLGTPRPGSDALDWRPVNACILLLPQVDGRAVVTAEGLAGADGGLHPAPRLLAETHGTQCGFCSPGFAVSLAALSRRPERDDETILDAIAGNLCRCTGYRPILEAARALPVVGPTADEPALAAALQEECAEALAYRAGTQAFFAPHDLAGALALIEENPGAWIVAGATDLGLRVTKRHEVPAAVISLGRIPQLAGIARDGTETVIGAAVPYADALGTLAELAPSLGALVRRLGAAQIRAVGTIGGNLGNASPIGDCMPPLIALGATVETVSRTGRRRIAAEDFVTGYRQTALQPGEIIAGVRIPDPAPDTAVRVYKVARRVDQDISAVSAAFALAVKDGVVKQLRAAFGGVADKPLRAPVLEAALTGRPWTLEAARAAAPAVRASVRPISDVRGSAGYRAAVCVNLVERLWWETAGLDGVAATLDDLEGAA